MVSRPGKMTIATFLCFSNGIKMKKPEQEDDLDPTRVPSDQLKAILKAEIQGIDSKRIQEENPKSVSRNSQRQNKTLDPSRDKNSRNSQKRNASLQLTLDTSANSRKPSAAFMAQPRIPYDEAIIKQKKDFSDPSYEIRHS